MFQKLGNIPFTGENCGVVQINLDRSCADSDFVSKSTCTVYFYMQGPRPMMGRARGPSTGGPRHALLGHGPRPLLGRPVGPRPLMRPAGAVDHVNFVSTCA